MSIPLPTNTTPILYSGYLSIVQDTQGTNNYTSVPHLYLSSSPLQIMESILIHKDTQDTDMRVIQNIKSYMLHWLSIDDIIGSTF